LLLDNCPSHKTYVTKKILKILKVPVIFSAPASFYSAPVELAFAALKQKNFDDTSPDQLRGGPGLAGRKLVGKQEVIRRAADYLAGLPKEKIKSMF